MNEILDKSSPSLVQSLDTQKAPNPKNAMKSAIIIVSIIAAGIASGWGVSLITQGNSGIGSSQLKTSAQVAESGVRVGDIVGVQDEKTFEGKTEGVLVEGGADGEGSHHLLRPGGSSQNVYLTSSTVDLNLFVGHKIEVMGETFAAQRAGWLMDVGRVKVLELNAQAPFEE